jgi:aryl-alcohol dehydrogenase-like predicted oxidoreductase
MDHTQPHRELYGVPFSTDSFNGMPYIPLGRSGLRVPKVGVGLWKVGFPETGDGARVDEKAAYAVLDRAHAAGACLWDTANRYNNASGNSERVIGGWFRRNPGLRRDVILATKVCGGMDGRTPNHGGLSRGCILDSVAACLARLQLESIDLLYFHRFDPLTPPEESLSAVEDLVQRGLVRYFAVSNFTVDQIETYRALEGSFSPRVRVLAVQNQFDILHGESEEYPGVLAHCARAGLSFVAWSPLARGLLSDRYLDPARARKGDRLVDEGSLSEDMTPEVSSKLSRLAALAREWNMPLARLALAYMLTLPGMGPLIPSASTPEQAEANAQAGKMELTAEQRGRVGGVVGG